MLAAELDDYSANRDNSKAFATRRSIYVQDVHVCSTCLSLLAALLASLRAAELDDYWANKDAKEEPADSDASGFS
jgi:hypothetical protein